MNKILKAAVIGAMLAITSGAAMADAKNPKIGFSIDDLRVERWTRDRDFFIAAAKGLGAEVYVQSADASEQRQIAQIENLISRGVDALVIVPYNATVLNNAIKEAKKAHIKVISYDRLILNSDIDDYISFDNEKVGEMQAEGVVRSSLRGTSTCSAARRPTTTPRCCAKTVRQGAGVWPGRRPRGRAPRHQRHPGDDGLQAAQADRLGSGQAGRGTGAQREAGLQFAVRQRHEKSRHRAAETYPADQGQRHGAGR